MKYKYQPILFLSLLLATPFFSRCQSNNPAFSSEDYLVSGTVSKPLTPGVNGTINAKEVNVTTTNWPDYVFRSDYSLPSLDSLNAEIKASGHLPGIPTADEVGREGQNLGEMNRLLLKKIEEPTLYIVQLNLELKQIKRNKQD